MPKKLIKRFLPDPKLIKENKNLNFLGDHLNSPNLWHLNRKSVSLAVAIGLFVAFIPTPGQMAIAAAVAIWLKANLPISVALVWLSNPLTMPPLFYAAYRLGLCALQMPAPAADFTFSLETFMSGLGSIWQPFLLGCFIIGSVLSLMGYLGIQFAWRRMTLNKWRQRKSRKMANSSNTS